MIRKYWDQLKESSWKLGILLDGYNDLKKGDIKWVSNGIYRTKWFADPFILSYDKDYIYLLVEEFDYHIHRGRIAKISVNLQTWQIDDCKILLDISTHLSFPMIWERNGRVFVCPENYSSGSWNIYEYDPISETLSYVRQGLSEKLTDAIVYETEKDCYLLSTVYPKPNGNVLSIWKYVGTKFEKQEDVLFPENIARNAGLIFSDGDSLIRPAQECNTVYGHSISFQKMTIDDGHFCYSEDYRYYSTHPKYNVGAHTFNQHKSGIAVIDVKGRRYPIIGLLIDTAIEVAIKLRLKKKYKLS